MKRKLLAAGVLALLSLGCAASRGPADAGAAVQEGLRAARRSYWQEAYFRFAAAHRAAPDNPAILNNLAVTLEALGRYDEALEMYKKAVAAAPSNRAIRRNYARFAEFYTAFARGAKPKEGDRDAAR